MTRRGWSILAVVTLTVAATLLTGCGNGNGVPVEAGRSKSMTVAASIFPVGDLTRQLLADVAEVTVLLPPGASPHGFELTPAKVNQLADADAIVTVGLGLDAWAERAAHATAAGRPVLRFADLAGVHDDHDASEEHDAHDQDHDHDQEADHEPDHDEAAHAGHDHPFGLNPHVWLDPVLTQTFVKHLSERLQQIYPEHAETIAGNAHTLLGELDAIDHEYRRRLANVSHKQMVTFHDAFNRLAERYGLEVVATLAPIELSPGGEVPPRRLSDAMRRIQDLGLAVVYAEPQFPDAAAQQIAHSTGTQVLLLDPVGGPGRPGYETYPAMMRSNLNTLVKGQSTTAATPR